MNSLEASGAEFIGMHVFSHGGKVWVYGDISTFGILIGVNDDFSVASNRKFSNTAVQSGTSDGNGVAYFVCYKSGKPTLIKVQESDYSILIERKI